MLKTKAMSHLKPIPWIENFITRPTLTWENYILAYGDLKQKESIPTNLVYKSLKEIYPQKNLMQIFQLVDFFKNKTAKFQASNLAQAYGFYWSEYHKHFLTLLPYLPESFKKWALAKNLKMNDLRPLLLIQSHQEQKTEASLQLAWSTYTPILEDIVKIQASYGEGKRLIELSVDLFYQKNKSDFKQLRSSSAKNAHTWLKRLQNLYYPQSHGQEQIYQAFIEKKSWPSPCQYKRNGDKKGFQVSAFISSSRDIPKAKTNLETNFDQLQDFFERGQD